MVKKGELSTLKAWLIVLASLADDAVLLVVIILAVRFFHVKITWPVILVTGLAVVIFFFIIHKAVVPSLRRRKMTGAEGMIGLTGKVSQALKPQGIIKVEDEYWKAKSVDGDIGKDEDVEVVGISGLVLEVKRKKS